MKNEWLNVRICDNEPRSRNTQTYREFMRESEEEFGLEQQDYDSMTDSELSTCLDYLDDLWNK